MLIKLATLVLGPCLLLQGKYVRKTTPLLPEAAGEREGVSGDGVRLRLLIIGDSAAAGVGVKHQDEALAGKLVGLLQKTYTLQWKLIARTGATTLSTFKMLSKLESKSYDVVVLSLGVNDVTGMSGSETWLAQQQRLLDKIKSLYTPRLIIVNGIPPMQLFPALPQPLRWYLGKKAALMSNLLQSHLTKAQDIVFLPLDFANDPGLMASDGFHPGPEAYSVWARSLAQLIQSRKVVTDVLADINE